MKPKKDCKTCGGTGVIQVPVYKDLYDEQDWEVEDCPECEAWNELIDEQINGD